MKRYLIFALITGMAFGAPDLYGQHGKRKQQRQQEQVVDKLDLQLERSPVFSKGFTGFALYDADKGEMLYEYNADKYFTPASNTKILTLYTALTILGDSIPALRWERQGDLTVFWGTGDPSFLNPHLEQNPQVLQTLKSLPGHLLYCPSNFNDHRYGEGWMWSDYPYYYQAEKSPFPIYSNVAHFYLDSLTRELVVLPSALQKDVVKTLTEEGDDGPLGRHEFANVFTYNANAVKGDEFDEHIPFRFSPEFLAHLLSDTLGREVGVLSLDIRPAMEAQTIYGLHADSLYRLLMQESDNFVAEQLLLLCATEVLNEMNTRKLIHYVKGRLLAELPDTPQWVDGSGLSRYNLITPRTLVALLDRIQRLVPKERLLGIFPAGGVSGTIQEYYRNGDQPYVFAKTGTLRNNHCLSGYLFTKSGRMLLFSFMHNNFTGSSAPYKKEMEKVLLKIRREVR